MGKILRELRGDKVTDSRVPNGPLCLCADPSSGHTMEEAEVSLLDQKGKNDEINAFEGEFERAPWQELAGLTEHLQFS